MPLCDRSLDLSPRSDDYLPYTWILLQFRDSLTFLLAFRLGICPYSSNILERVRLIGDLGSGLSATSNSSHMCRRISLIMPWTKLLRLITVSRKQNTQYLAKGNFVICTLHTQSFLVLCSSIAYWVFRRLGSLGFMRYSRWGFWGHFTEYSDDFLGKVLIWIITETFIYLPAYAAPYAINIRPQRRFCFWFST